MEFTYKFEGIEVIQVMNAKVKIYILVVLGESDFKVYFNMFHCTQPLPYRCPKSSSTFSVNAQLSHNTFV